LNKQSKCKLNRIFCLSCFQAEEAEKEQEDEAPSKIVVLPHSERAGADHTVGKLETSKQVLLYRMRRLVPFDGIRNVSCRMF
jgi:hypothetical protein